MSLSCSSEMITYVNQIIRKSVSVLSAKPPCPFVVVTIGSLARGEATPYSDLEYMFLIKRTTPAMEAYFERLAITTYFLIGNLRETKLSGMAIEELEGWFDDCGKNGFKIDGLHKKAGNIPTGNGVDGVKNQFIMTFDELSEEYKQCFTYPNQAQAVQGDLTAMLKYIKVVYSYNLPKDPLEALQTDISRAIPSMERIEINEKMLKSDIAKFDFRPSAELEGKGYTLNVKKDMFRFPSILLLDLAIIHNTPCISSWDVPILLQKTGRLTAIMADVLSFLLATACYIRLAAYLHHDAHDDRISVAKSTSTQNGRHVSFKTAYRRYYVQETLYTLICSRIITLKNDLCNNDVGHVLKADQQSEETWFNKIEIFHSAGRFKQALDILQKTFKVTITRVKDESIILDILKAHCSVEMIGVIADIFLKVSAYQAALCVHTYLFDIKKNDTYKLRIAECFRKLGKLKESLEILTDIHLSSADEHYQMGMVCLSIVGKHKLAEMHLITALFSYHNRENSENLSIEVFTQLRREHRLAVITSANPKTADCLMGLGDLYRQLADHTNARAYLKKAFEVLAESYGEEAVIPAAGHYLQHSGVVYSDGNDHARAKDYFMQSLSIYKRAFGDDSYHIYIANTLYNIGKTADIDCDYSEAEAHFRHSLSMYREVFGINGEQENVARILLRLGDVLVKRGEIYEAEGCYSRSLDILGKVSMLSPCEMARIWRDVGMNLKQEDSGQNLAIRYLTHALSLYDNLPHDEETLDT